MKKMWLIGGGTVAAIVALMVAVGGKPDPGNIVVPKAVSIGCHSRDALVRAMGMIDRKDTQAFNAELLNTGACEILRQSERLEVKALDGDYLMLERAGGGEVWTYWSYVTIEALSKTK